MPRSYGLSFPSKTAIRLPPDAITLVPLRSLFRVETTCRHKPACGMNTDSTSPVVSPAVVTPFRSMVTFVESSVATIVKLLLGFEWSPLGTCDSEGEGYVWIM